MILHNVKYILLPFFDIQHENMIFSVKQLKEKKPLLAAVTIVILHSLNVIIKQSCKNNPTSLAEANSRCRIEHR